MSTDNVLSKDNEEPHEELSLREQLESAFDKVEAKEANVAAEEPRSQERTRDTTGRFAKGAKAEEADVKDSTAPAPEANATATQPNVEVAPNSWKAEAKAKWSSVSPEIRAEILRREEEVHRGFSRLDEERNLGKHFNEAVTPYLPMIQAEGANALDAVKNLLHTAYQLRVANPTQKADLLIQLAHTYGADLNRFQNSSANNAADPVRHLQSELAHLKHQLYQQETYKNQVEQSSLQQQIDSFRSDPKHQHFEQVRNEMGAFLQSGVAKNLEEAYEMAVWGRPDIRSTLLESQMTEREAQKATEIKQRAEAARRASPSVRGGPGITVPNGGTTGKSVRELLEDAFESASWN